MKSSLLKLWLIALWLPAITWANPQEFTLDNGLKVIIHEDHRAAIVTSQLWYKVGASYEYPGQTGVSHALEHMLFKGSSKLCAGESSTVLNSLGAIENAATTADATLFFQDIAAHYLDVALEIMADQMSTAHWSEAQWATEHDIIKNERGEIIDNDPDHRQKERLLGVAFPSSGYANPVIGWKQDLDRLHTRQLQQWYSAWYAPNNAVLVIAGDVTFAQAKAHVEHFFGAIARRELPIANTPLELPTPGERSTVQDQPSLPPRLSMAFNVPTLTTQNEPGTAQALQLLSELLGGSESALLHTRLKRDEQLLSQADSAYNPISRGDTLLLLNATLNTQKSTSLREAKERIWALIDTVKAAPPSASDLDRVRNRLIAQQVFRRDSIPFQALHLAELEVAGLSWKQDAERLQKLKALTPEDIQRVAQTFLTRDRLTTSYTQKPELPHE